VTTYRGSGRGTEVHGLEPNTRYKFRLRLVSPRSHSRLSPPLEVWTAPAPPSSPIIVRDETKAIVLNWRAGPGGATKYVLESRLVNSRGDGTAAQAPTPTVRHLAAPVRAHVRHRTNATAASYDWKVSYEGHETTVRVCGLQPRSTYRFRVRALNDAGHGGPPSALTQASTASEAQMLVPRRAAEQFSVRAAGDIVVGDTILFTERLLVDRGGNGALLGEPARGSARPLASNANRGNCRSRNATGPQHVGSKV
jgi:hypothetical protein